jgi:hypothetical protein
VRNYLLFVSDQDAPGPNAESYFANVRLYVAGRE